MKNSVQKILHDKMKEIWHLTKVIKNTSAIFPAVCSAYIYEFFIFNRGFTLRCVCAGFSTVFFAKNLALKFLYYLFLHFLQYSLNTFCHHSISTFQFLQVIVKKIGYNIYKKQCFCNLFCRLSCKIFCRLLCKNACYKSCTKQCFINLFLQFILRIFMQFTR